MARRRELSEEQLRSVARQALDKIAGADDPDAAAAQAFRQAPSSRVRQAVVGASTGAADDVTRAILRAALNSGDAEAARAATELLVDLSGTPAGVDLLKECFADAEAPIRRRAAEALESFQQPELASYLARALTDEEDTVRRSATGTFGIIIGTPSHGLRAAVVEQLAAPDSDLARAVTENDDVQVRRQIAQALAFVDSPEVLPTLEALVGDADEEVRQEAVLSLAAIGSDRAVELMGAALEDTGYRVASTVLDMLAASLGSGSGALLEHLRRALDHPLPEVRHHAVLMLDRYPPADVEELLEKATRDRSFEVSREAGQMLRGISRERHLDWLSEEMEEQVAGERARTVWEAGDIGHEAGPAGAPGEAEEAIELLEQALREGSSSEKVHALNELSSLVDIGDSDAMQQALDDRDSAVRSRAADSFAYTHDAGFLVRMLREHEDPLVRRRAAEALIGNPGGPKQRGRELARSVTFTSARTAGLVLFGHFLHAFQDPDPGVQQLACEAVRETAQHVGLVPVRPTLAALNRLMEGEDASVLLLEDAEHAAQVVGEARYGGAIVEGAEEVLQWRGELARRAHAIRWDADAGAYSVAGEVGAEAVEEWLERYGVAEEEAESVGRAVSGQGALPTAAADAVLDGLARDLLYALSAMGRAARALRLIGREQEGGSLEDWARALSAGPSLDWGGPEQHGDAVRRLVRLRRTAWMEAEWARRAVAGTPNDGFLHELLEDEDEGVRLAALAAQAEIAPEDADLEQMQVLAERNADEHAFAGPVGQAALALVRAGREGGVPVLRRALAATRVRPRLRLTQSLAAAAQEEAVRRLLEDSLEGDALREPQSLCVALAVRAAGGETSDPPPAEELDSAEARCAALALRAAANEAAPAEQLQTMLREGESAECYLSAGYLAVARVWSAVLVFSSVRDQDVPLSVQLICASSLVERGHPGGLAWFEKVADTVHGVRQARRVLYMSRAVENVIPLMLNCNAVNVGRFV